MNDKPDRQPRAEPPPEPQRARVETPPKSAAGLPSITKALSQGLKHMGVRRTLATFFQVNQKEGFDCQSCAWPNPDDDRKLVEFCENGAKAVAAEGTRARVTPDFFREWSVQQLGDQPDFWLDQQGRITHPMVLRAGSTHYEPVSWDVAFNLIASELRGLDSPHEAAFYTSGRTSNETAFIYQLFVRQFGTNNLPDCSNMCHESSGTALLEQLGSGKGSARLEDFDQADLIFIIGQNPGTNHPRMLSTLQRAKERGARIISMNPLREAGLVAFRNPNFQYYSNPLRFVRNLVGSGVPLSDLFLNVKINGDLPALKGLMKALVREETYDRDFVQGHTSGFEEFANDVKATSWDEITAGSGLSREEIEAASRLIGQARRMICCWAMGLTQHRNAVATIQMVVNLLLLGGHIGRPGTGTCPVRGHSNVQGDRTMGIWEDPSAQFLEALGREFNFAPPADPGMDTVDTIHAMRDGRVKVFFALGGNFLSATPDTALTAEALASCRLTVQVSTKLNRSHIITGQQALILPCLGRSEIDRQTSGVQFVTVEDSMSVVSSSRGVLEPASEHLRSEPAIVAALAKATLGSRSGVDWDGLAGSYDTIRDRIARVVPGFEDFNERIRRGSFYLPNATRERNFRTSTGKARFIVHKIDRWDLSADEFLMMTIRSHDQFNTTIYGMDDRYRGVFGGRRVVFLNAEDILEQGLQGGQMVDLISHFNGQERTAHRFQIIPYKIPRRCAATYYPETNVLVSIDDVALRSNTPASKSIRIRVRPARD